MLDSLRPLDPRVRDDGKKDVRYAAGHDNVEELHIFCSCELRLYVTAHNTYLSGKGRQPSINRTQATYTNENTMRNEESKRGNPRGRGYVRRHYRNYVRGPGRFTEL